MKFCLKCGNQLKDDMKFCDKCGVTCDVSDTPQVTHSTSQPVQSESKSKSAKISKPRKGLLIFGIIFLIFAAIYSIIAATSMKSMSGMAVLVGIVGIMFIILSRTQKGQKYLRGEKGLKKSFFVAICLVAGFISFGVITGMVDNAVPAENTGNNSLPTSSLSYTNPPQYTETTLKTPDELVKIFTDFSADKNITIDNAENELSALLDTEIKGDFSIKKSSYYEGQYLATFDVYDAPKGEYSLDEAKELARNIVYYINAAREKYDLPIVYVAFSIIGKDALSQTIVTGLESRHIDAAPEGSWSDKPMTTDDYIKYVQDKYAQEINAVGKTESEYRAFYDDGIWQPAKPALELLDFTAEKNSFFSITITGTVRNNTDKKYSYVQIEFNLYDKSGAQVGTALGNITNLEPYGIWEFEAIGLVSNATMYSFSDLSGW